MRAIVCGVLSLVAAHSKVFASILGTDDRRVDGGEMPWTNAVGHVMRNDARGGELAGIGTAFLVGPRVILTNWHNVFGEAGAFQAGEWVYVPQRDAPARKVRILRHLQFTPVTPRDLPLGPRTRRHDVIALILEEALEYAPLPLAPPAPRERDVTGIGAGRYTMAGVSLTTDYDGATPRTVQTGCSFASLAYNAQFPRAPGLVGHTCDVWPGHSGAPLVDTVNGRAVVRALNVAQVYPELSRDAYERRRNVGENIPLSLSNHINIAVVITPQIVDIVRRANAFAAALPASVRTAAR